MGAKKKVGFWDGISPKAKAITILLAILAVLKLGQIWLQKPKVEVKAEKKLTTINAVARNITRMTRSTSPSGVVTVTEERDLTTENSRALESTLTSSLSVPVGETGRTWGVSVGYEPLTKEWWGGASYQPFTFLPIEVGVQSNFRDRVLVGGSLRF